MPVALPRRITITVAVFVLASWPAIAADWSSCASDLDTLRRRASEASDTAEEADSKKREYEDAMEEYRNCRSMPSVYDLLRDGCESQRWEAESARDNYRSALSDLESALDDVDSSVRSVSSSCEVDIGSVSARATHLNALPPNLRQRCAVYARYIGRLPNEKLRELCRQHNTASDCARCIP